MHKFVSDENSGDCAIICEDDVSFEFESLWKRDVVDLIEVCLVVVD